MFMIAVCCHYLARYHTPSLFGWRESSDAVMMLSVTPVIHRSRSAFVFFAFLKKNEV
jgi:hypothetical protein